MKAQNPSLAGIQSAIEKGDVSQLAQLIDNTLILTLNNNQSIYSRAQAEMILRDFFNKNKPGGFLLKESGNSNGSYFGIGQLSAGSKSYRTYFLLRNKGRQVILQELRIEK